MKPNHNLIILISIKIEVVYTMSKIQNETKSQQGTNIVTITGVVYTMSKIQNEP